MLQLPVVLPEGFRFRTADEAGPQAAIQAHIDAWAPSTYTASSYEGLRRTSSYYRRRGLGRAMLLHGMHLARDAGANHMTVVCLGAPSHPSARGLYYSVGFQYLTRDAPLLKPSG